MKTESVQFNTKKTLQEIINVLNSFRCNIDRVQSDPFTQDRADIEVVMIGMATMADAAKSIGAGKSGWGVQVYVYDRGKYRSVELVALGESGFKYAMTEGRGHGAFDSMINGQDYLNIRHSRKYRDRIMEKLEPVKSAPKSASDASRSRLLGSMQSLSAASDDALADRIFAEMPVFVERFCENHPDYSEKDSLMMDCAGMYSLSGNREKASELAAKAGVTADGKEILENIVGTLPEILQYAENDSIAGNDRSALYTAAYYLSVYEKGGNNMLFLLYNLLDGVIRMENSGADISEDLRIWPLLAKNSGFSDWHASKYGDDGSAGRLDASDPAVMGARGAGLTRRAPAQVPKAEPLGLGRDTSSSAADRPTKSLGLGAAAAAVAAGTAGAKAASEGRSSSVAGGQRKPAQSDASAGQRKPASSGSRGSKNGKSGGGLPFDRKYLILAAAFLAVIVLTAVIVTSINKARYGQTPATDYVAESSENSENQANIADGGGITVLSSDWDWDSYRNEDGTATVDAILLVRNDSDKAITSIDFTISSKDGDPIDNTLSPGAPFTVRGYVKSGDTGIMIGEICPDEVKVVPDDSTYAVTSKHTTGIDDYIVPTGYVSRHYGEGKNDYDVSLDNPNDFEVSSNATIVMAKIKDNKIVDSDATGSLSSSIAPNTTGFIQEKAFYDPHLYVKDTEVTVYAIDTDFCMRAD